MWNKYASREQHAGAGCSSTSCACCKIGAPCASALPPQHEDFRKNAHFKFDPSREIMCEINAHPVSTALVQIAPYQGAQGCLRPGACLTLSRVKIHHPAKIHHLPASASGSAQTLPASPAGPGMMPAAAPLCLRVEEQPRGAVACLPADGQDVLQGAVVDMRDPIGLQATTISYIRDATKKNGSWAKSNRVGLGTLESQK